jgi:hypothetical protein
MALINTIIEESGFEIVKKRIGAILKIELDNQKTLQGFNFPISVFIDRITPFDKSEVVIVNVRFDSLNKSNQTQYGSQDSIVYNIDVYATAIQNSAQRGDELSSSIRDKFTAMIAAILDSNIYNSLSLDQGLIMSTTVDGIDPYETSNNQDANFTTMGRVNYSVRLYQDYEVWEGVLFNQNLTDVKLDLTDLGYKYEIIN